MVRVELEPTTCESLVQDQDITTTQPSHSNSKHFHIREGELYIADNFFQLSEVNEIISALCTVDI